MVTDGDLPWLMVIFSDWWWLTVEHRWMMEDDWRWLTMTNNDRLWLTVTEDDWLWLMVTDCDSWWRTVTNGDWRTDEDWRLLSVTDGDWRWLMVNDGDWWWLTVTDADWLWSPVTESDWWWLSPDRWWIYRKFTICTREGQFRAVYLLTNNFALPIRYIFSIFVRSLTSDKLERLNGQVP